jgi:hypothetical protein
MVFRSAWPALAAIAFGWGVAATAHAVDPCPPGRYRVTEGRLLPEAGTDGTEVVVLEGATASVTSGCPAVPATLRAKRNGTTRVVAKWPTETPCAGLPATAIVKGKLTESCGKFTGRLKAPKAKPKRRPFVALRSTCGDAIIDPDVGEACDGTALGVCASGCTAECACVPIPGVFLLAPDNRIARIRGSAPATIETTLTVTGLRASELLVGIDFRPATRELYALGIVDGGASDDPALYVIDPTTGVATRVGGPAAPITGGTTWGFDFNPVVDRIRIVNDALANLRFNPSTGVLTDTDTALNPNSASIIGAAYDRNVKGATATTLYAIDVSGVMLVRIGGPDGNPSPNTGIVTEIGSLMVPIGPDAGFDIDGPTNTAWAVLTEFFTGVVGLYTIDLSTGAATLVGAVGDGTQHYVGLAVSPDGA